MTVPGTFQQWIESLIAGRFGTKTKLAQAIGVSLTQIGRGANAGKYSVENLLKLAKVAAADPSTVLRLAGKGDVADLLEDLYGKSTLTPMQREWLKVLGETPESLRGLTMDLASGHVLALVQFDRAQRDAHSGVSPAVHPHRVSANRKATRRR